MKRTKENKSVADKVDAVLTLHNAQNPGVPLTVSALARKAGVSRANLYVSHPQLIAKLPKKRDQKEHFSQEATSAQAKKIRSELAELKRINKALLLLNIELRRELARVNQRLAEKSLRKK